MSNDPPPAVQPAPMNFTTFLRGLANEALIQFGAIPHPVTGERALNLTYARATVQVLGLLAEKTRGNLDKEEDDYLRTVLASLRERLAKAEKAEAAKPS